MKTKTEETLESLCRAAEYILLMEEETQIDLDEYGERLRRATKKARELLTSLKEAAGRQP